MVTKPAAPPGFERRRLERQLGQHHSKPMTHPLTIRVAVTWLAFATLAGAEPGSSVQMAPATRAGEAPPPVPSDPSIGIPKTGNETFFKKHESFLRRGKEGPIGILFLGDSITEGWGTKAPELWEEHFGKFQPANFGIGGDGMQHVIWRVEQGELDDINPRLVVLMLGTNNTAAHTAEQILAAHRKLHGLIREKLPAAKLLIVAVLPRGPRERDGKVGFEHRMGVIRTVNAGLAKLADGKQVRFLDVGPLFLGADGKIPNELMPDQLHPNAAGYRIFAEALKPVIEEMMK